MNILSWYLDKILYLLVILSVLFAEGLDSFQKSILILMVVILISLASIKEAIKNSNK